jgi:hypothetical protein
MIEHVQKYLYMDTDHREKPLDLSLSFVHIILLYVSILTFSQELKKHEYEGDSVNGSQMDIKRKICDIRTWKKHLLLDISSTNIDTLVPSLYQRVETRNCFLATSAPGRILYATFERP